MPTEFSATHVAVLGLGRMGTAIAGALVAAGHRTTVWNRTRDRAEDLVDRGARRAETVAEAIADSDLILLALADSGAVREVLQPAAHLLAGRSLVNFTTSTPEQAQALSQWLTERGADYLDGAMLAVPQAVGTPEAMFLYSGSEATYVAYQNLFGQLASGHYLGPDPGTAELWDLALLGSGYAALAGFLHSLALLDAAGVRPSQAVPLVVRWLSGIAEFMPVLGEEIESGDYGAGVSPVGINREAVANLARVSAAHGVSPEVHAPLRGLLDRRTADGHATDSFASLFELLRATPH